MDGPEECRQVSGKCKLQKALGRGTIPIYKGMHILKLATDVLELFPVARDIIPLMQAHDWPHILSWLRVSLSVLL